jgi:hypothetical protein
MFSQTWKKYLPVIVILLKRSVNEPQTLTMNHTDFSRAAGGRKIKYSFHSLFLNNGRIDNTVKHSPLAREFAEVLQENEQSKRLLQKQNLEFSMNNDFQLTIKNSTPVSDPEPAKSAEEMAN